MSLTVGVSVGVSVGVGVGVGMGVPPASGVLFREGAWVFPQLPRVPIGQILSHAVLRHYIFDVFLKVIPNSVLSRY